MAPFSIDGFAADCKAAMAAADDRHGAAQDCLQRCLAENDAADIVAVLEAAIPAGADVGEMIVHQSDELTMLYARIPPRFQSGIHNHTVFACIGQLAGAEESTVYERDSDGLRVAERMRAEAGEVIALPADVIHHIENPGDATASSLHIYGGDFAALMGERSLWTTSDHAETSFDFQRLLVESVAMMKASDNRTGLDALVSAIPAARPLVEGA